MTRHRGWVFAAGGAAAWAALWIVPLAGGAALIERLVMFAMLAIAPVGLMLAAAPDREGKHPRIFTITQWAQPFAALLAAASFFLPTGIIPALMAAPWLIVCGGAALFGLRRIIPRGFGGAAETCIDAGLLYLPVGGAWLILARLGASPMGFSGVIVTLTAIHFHYAGFAAPILAGMAGRQLNAIKSPYRRVFAVLSVGVIAGIALVAAGITLSPLVEVAAALLLAVSMGGVAILSLGMLGTFEKPTARILIAVSSLALIGGMILAGTYAVSEFTGAGWIVIQQMVQYHGIANAAGLIAGLAGWGMVITYRS